MKLEVEPIYIQCLGHNSWWGARLLISLVEFQSRNILRLIALSEIIILPFTAVLVFTYVHINLFFFFSCAFDIINIKFFIILVLQGTRRFADAIHLFSVLETASRVAEESIYT